MVSKVPLYACYMRRSARMNDMVGDSSFTGYRLRIRWCSLPDPILPEGSYPGMGPGLLG